MDERLLREGEVVVYTGGVWDLLHDGHGTFLQEAKALGKRLLEWAGE